MAANLKNRILNGGHVEMTGKLHIKHRSYIYIYTSNEEMCDAVHVQ